MRDMTTEKIPAPAPGVYPDVPFEDYCRWDAMNHHTAVHANKSARHLLSAINGYMDGEDTESRKFGRAIHCAILEPELFTKRFLVSTRCVAVKKDGEVCGCRASVMSPTPRHWDEFLAQADHVLTQCGYKVRHESEDSASVYYENCKAHVRVSDHPANEKTVEWMQNVRCEELRFDSPATVVDQLSTVPGVNLNTANLMQFWYCGKQGHAPHDAKQPLDYIDEEKQNRIERIKSALKDHPVIKMLRARGGHEVSIVAEIDGVLCKARLDKLILGKVPTIVDLKKCRAEESGMEKFGKAVRDYHYDQQAAMYVDIVREATGQECCFKWVVIEDSDDPIVEVWNASERIIDVGRVKYRNCLGAYKASMASGRWPTYTSKNAKELLMPEWYGKDEIKQLEATIQ